MISDIWPNYYELIRGGCELRGGFNSVDEVTWYPVPGTRYLVPGTWSQVPARKYLVPGTWYQVPGTGYLDLAKGASGVRTTK